MKHLYKTIIPLIFLLRFGACSSKDSHPKKIDKQSAPTKIEVSDAWARPAAQGGNSAAYLNIFNGTDATDTLLSVSTDAAPMAQVHESYEENGLSGMRPAGKLAIAPSDSLAIKPGGYHIMLMQLKHDLSSGDSLRLTLHFSSAGARHITAPVKLSN